MSKDYIVVFPISRECAHQVAMTAAEAAARIASPSTVDMDRLGEAVAKAYLQAYEAVEGWTRSQNMEEFNARHGTSYVADRAHMEELHRKYSSLQPKDE